VSPAAPLVIPPSLAVQLLAFAGLTIDLEDEARRCGAGDVADALHQVAAAVLLVLESCPKQ